MVERPVPLPPLDRFWRGAPRAERPPNQGPGSPSTSPRQSAGSPKMGITEGHRATQGPMALVVPSTECHGGRVMSMYTHILEAALRERRPPGTEMTTGEALIELFECRYHLASSASSEWSADWNSKAQANQVAYDLALIDVARSVGLDCD